MNQISTPQGCKEQTLTYKVASGKACDIMFMPPTYNRYAYAPVYFIIPGGGWHVGNALDMYNFSRKSAEYARANGWAVVSTSYRLTGDGVSMYQIISDCMDVCRYLSHFSEILKIDANHIVSSGHSAGGQLALMVALAPHEKFRNESSFSDDFRVVATAPLSPPTVLYGGDDVPQTLAFSMTELFPMMTNEELKDTSPVSYVSQNSVPCLAVAGDRDNLVFPVSSEMLIRKYKDCGADGTLVYSHLGGHCFESMVEGEKSNPDFDAVQQILITFLNRFEK